MTLSTAYHPQTDGQTERINQCLEMYLRCLVQDSPKSWKSWLSLAELWYNSSFHSALGCSPFKALYGYEPNLGSNPTPTTETPQAVTDVITHREEHLQLLKQRLEQAQNRMKIQADKHRSDRQFAVGDQVLLKLQPYTQRSVASRAFPKLAYKFFGPYKILERIGAMAYRLELPQHSEIHPVFHISQLKPSTPDYTPVFSTLPSLVDLQATGTIPKAILQRRLVKKGNTTIPQVLVTWSGLLTTSAMWEDYDVLKTRFPAAPTWGQAASPAEGGVKT